jgi:DNA-directed RNA polymerase subunit H (RpoH/RPB5)
MEETLKYFKAKKMILTHLAAQGYDTAAQSLFTINDVHTKLTAGTLDLQLTRDRDNKRTAVKFHQGTMKWSLLKNYVQAFETDELASTDDMIIIIKGEPNETVLSNLKKIWEDKHYFLIVISLDRLQFNIMEHVLVPPHTVLNDAEALEVKRYYNVNKDTQLPEISRFSHVAQVIGLRPGQLCKIVRSSKTEIRSDFYRICC